LGLNHPAGVTACIYLMEPLGKAQCQFLRLKNT